jgi:hypothetical protein
MPSVVESGRLQLSREEAGCYRAAAERLHDACEMVLDLAQPITTEEWIALEVTNAAIRGDLNVLQAVIASVEIEVESRRRCS